MLTILIVNLFGLLSPGPDFFYVSRKAASSTTRNAILGSVGIGLGVSFWAAIAIFGLAILNSSMSIFQYIAMILGGGFLAYTGFKMVQVKENVTLSDGKTKGEVATSALQEIGKGLMINLSNGKVVVFFSSVLSGFASAISGYAEMSLAVILLGVESTLYFILVTLLFSRKPIRQFYAKHSRYIDNIAGIIFILYGSKLIYSGIMPILN